DETVYKKCFTDVQEDWYAKYVCYAEEEGWVQGYNDGNFRPGAYITRTEAMKIIFEALEWELEGTVLSSSYTDVDRGSWYEPYLMMAEEKGLLDKLDLYITPHELISRKQMSDLLYRAVKSEAGESFDIWEIEDGDDLSYEEVLETGITASYPGDMDFAHNSQSGWSYGCYTFAVKNLLEWRYDLVLNVAELQERIGWDGEFIWNTTEFENFAEEYDMDVIFTYNGSAEFFFKKLAKGEPLVMYIPYYSGGVNIGHQVVAYSFDENGVWIADSISGGVQRQIGFDEVFLEDAHTTTNLTDVRSVKAGGVRWSQMGR
ncbi:S-layer homology domain-containing protein, partial [Candidatus Peregrinibacteria bacterium]|nr:S-layer homology domain-containing protein [Candidatus Peregrinibacteria bacterium]